MVSARLSLSQSVQSTVPARPAMPKQDTTQARDGSVNSKGFAAYIAPERQEMRGRAQNGEPSKSDSGSTSRIGEPQEQIGESDRTEDTDAGRAAASDENSQPEVSDESPDRSNDQDEDGEKAKDPDYESDLPVNPSASDGETPTPTEELPYRTDSTESADAEADGASARDANSAHKESVAGVAGVPVDGKTQQATDSATDADAEQSEDSIPRLQRKQAANTSPVAARSAGEQTADESGSPRHASADVGAETDEPIGSQSSGEDRKDRSDSRAGHTASAASEEIVINGSKAGSDKPNFIESLREDRPEQRSEAIRSSEATSPRPSQSGTEPITLPRLDPAGAADRLSGQLQSERSGLSARPEQEAAVSQSVTRGMNAVLRQGGGALTMKLSPATLGDIRIEMTMQSGKVSVQFDVGSLAAYEAVKGQIGELKHSLEQRGMTVERVEAHISPALARSSQSEGQTNQRSGDQPTHSGDGQDGHDASDGESRGRSSAEDRANDAEQFAGGSGDAFGNTADFEQTLNIGLDAVA